MIFNGIYIRNLSPCVFEYFLIFEYFFTIYLAYKHVALLVCKNG